MVLLNFFDTSKVMIAKQSSEPHSKMRISFSNTSYDIFGKLKIINKYENYLRCDKTPGRLILSDVSRHDVCPLPGVINPDQSDVWVNDVMAVERHRVYPEIILPVSQ